MLKKIGNAIACQPMDQLEQNLGGCIQLTPLAQNRFLGIWSLLHSERGFMGCRDQKRQQF